MKKIIALLISMMIFSIYASEKPKLIVYTHDSFASKKGPGGKIKPIFEKRYNVELEFVATSDAVSMFNKFKLEGINNKADLVYGIDQNMLKDAEDTGLFEKANVDLSKLSPNLNWKNNTFIPFDFGQFAFIYNTKKVTNLPKSLPELVNDQKIKLIYQDPRVSTVGQGLLLWMNYKYPQQQELINAWKELAKHTVTVSKGWSEGYGLFLKGEADMVLSYTSSELYHRLVEKNNQYKALIFDQHPLQIELIAKTKTSKHKDLADKFINFILEPEIQKIIVYNNWMLPVINQKMDDNFTPLLKIDSIPIKEYSNKEIKVMQELWKKALL